MSVEVSWAEIFPLYVAKTEAVSTMPFLTGVVNEIRYWP